MTDMSETPTQETPVEVPVTAESAPTEVAAVAATPEKKKRGRKPKVPVPPTAPIVAAAPPKPRKRRTPEVRATKGERAIAAAISAAQVDRVKCIAKCAKVMQLQFAEKGVLESIDWQIAMLSGNPTNPTPGPGYSTLQVGSVIPPYPYPTATPYTPPSMRQPTLPIEPRANGGAEGIVDDADNDDPDQFLKGSGTLGGGGFV